MRQEMKLPPQAPLCPFALCRHLEVPVQLLSDLPQGPYSDYFATIRGQRAFSAVAYYEGTLARIVVNDSHSMKRIASDVAHEVAHILERHPPLPIHVDGRRLFSLDHEEEAEWLGPALLASEEAALHAYGLICQREATLAELSDLCGITENIIQMRMNVVGAAKRFRATVQAGS